MAPILLPTISTCGFLDTLSLGETVGSLGCAQTTAPCVRLNPPFLKPQATADVHDSESNYGLVTVLVCHIYRRTFSKSVSVMSYWLRRVVIDIAIRSGDITGRRLDLQGCMNNAKVPDKHLP